MFAPYDVPSAVRGAFDDELDRFVIEFQYPGESEQFETISSDTNISLRVGKRSKRLWGVEINMKALGAAGVELNVRLQETIANKVAEALDGLAKRSSPKVSGGSYALAKKALSMKQAELLKAIAA